MKIGVDARFFGPVGKGLGRYTQKLIENIEKNYDQSDDSVVGRLENQYYIFLNQENFSQYQPTARNFHKVLADYRWYSLREQLKMPGLLNRYDLDLVHFPHFNVPIFYRRKFIVTIHDLILLHFPTVRGTTLNPLFYWVKFLFYKIVIWSAIFRSQKIITVSNFTKNDILANYNIAPEKIAVTYEACEDFCSTGQGNDAGILAKYGIIKPFLMYVGNAYPHKNLENLVRAFRKLCHDNPGRDLQLALVGKEDYFYLRLREFVEKNQIRNVVFTGYVPDADLDVFFHNVAAYVWPSLYEGFGLSPLEAMAKGAPVISSDHSCMKEILGNSALFFNGLDVDDIASSINAVLDNDALKNDLIRKGYQQVQKFSWKKMALETEKIYQLVGENEK